MLALVFLLGRSALPLWSSFRSRANMKWYYYMTRLVRQKRISFISKNYLRVRGRAVRAYCWYFLGYYSLLKQFHLDYHQSYLVLVR